MPVAGPSSGAEPQSKSDRFTTGARDGEDHCARYLPSPAYGYGAQGLGTDAMAVAAGDRSARPNSGEPDLNLSSIALQSQCSASLQQTSHAVARGHIPWPWQAIVTASQLSRRHWQPQFTTVRYCDAMNGATVHHSSLQADSFYTHHRWCFTCLSVTQTRLNHWNHTTAAWARRNGNGI